MDTKRLALFGTFLLALIAGFAYFAPETSGTDGTRGEQRVVSVSTFPLYEAARSVAGETLDIRLILPPGVDPHVFSPNPKEVADISNSVLFVYSGAGFEHWAESLRRSLPSGVETVDMSRHVMLLERDEGAHHDEDEDHHGEDGEHHHGAYDPHYWLDIDNMIAMTRVLDEEFSKSVPSEAERFHRNAAGYIAELERLKSEYTVGLAECKNRMVVSNHDAFGYLAHAYGFETASVTGLSSDEQPNAKKVAQIVALVREHGVKILFFEAMVSDRAAQAIAQETGVQVRSLQPLANISPDELTSNQTYISIMRSNLAALREAMECR